MKFTIVLFLIATSVLTVFSQGNVDTTFGTNGIYANWLHYEKVVGGVLQTNGVNQDKIIVGSGLGNEFKILRVGKNGGLDTAFGNNSGGRGIANLGSPVTAIGITIDKNDNPFVAGHKNNSNCVVSKFNSSGGGSQNLTLPLPTGTNVCQVFGVKSDGVNVYVFGGTYQNGGTMAVTIYRIVANTFILDTSWGGNGYVRTILGPNASSTTNNCFAMSLAVDYPNKVYVSAMYMFNLSNQSNAFIGYNFNGSLLTSGFGTVKPDFMAGFGVYTIPGFVASDMIYKPPFFFLGGGRNTNNFEMVKIPINASRQSDYKTVDLMGKESISTMTLNNSGKIIAAGTTKNSYNNWQNFGLAKYDTQTDFLTSVWNPNKLQLLDSPLSVTTPSTWLALNGDRRVFAKTSPPQAPSSLDPYPPSNQFQMLSVLAQTSVNRIICVSSLISYKPNGAVNDEVVIVAFKDN